MCEQLYMKSYYSFDNGLASFEQMIQQCKKLGYQTVAITDKNVMINCIGFFNMAKKAALKPIIGVQVQFEHDKSTSEVTILCKNNNGFLGLCSLDMQVAFSLDDLKRLEDDCFFLFNSDDSLFTNDLVLENNHQVIEKLNFLKTNLKNVRIGLSFQESSFWQKRNQILKASAKEVGLQTVAVPKVYYLNDKDEEALQCLLAISHNTTIEDKNINAVSGRYLLSKEEMKNLYDEDDLNETIFITKSCEVDLSKLQTSLPIYDNQKGISNAIYLQKLAEVGLQKRLQHQVPAIYQERLKEELSIITKMGFENYFLMVYDIVRYCHKNNIYVGPGRGSAAGSLTAYVLGITQVDPIAYGLLFERFLNPERISMPDIDIDFPADKRQLVIAYVTEKYGKSFVAQILTLNHMSLERTLLLVGEQYKIHTAKIQEAIRLVSKLKHCESFSQMCAQSDALKALLQSNEKQRKWFKATALLEKIPRNRSVHASGVVLSQKPLEQLLPVFQETDCNVVQYTNEYLEAIGLVKMDLLGLKQLTLLAKMQSMIQATQSHFSLLKIPFNDVKTFELLSRGDTKGVFQLESLGMQALLKKMKPHQFLDIPILLALYRPGPMANIDTFLKNRLNPQSVKVQPQVLNTILKETYGIFVYQEQVMMAARVLAGFSLGKADILRKAMAKKNEKELLRLKADFLTGCQQKGLSEIESESIFKSLFQFSAYGFNKSHAVSYSFLVYQTAYLKANYPVIYYVVQCNQVVHDKKELYSFIQDAKNHQISILPIDVNKSGLFIQSEGHQMRLGLTMIQDVKESIAQLIIDERQKGAYKHYIDFILRMYALNISANIIYQLIWAGALDQFGYSRTTMENHVEGAVGLYEYARLIQIVDEKGTYYNFNLLKAPQMMKVSDNARKVSENEKRVLGFYLKGHPIQLLREKLTEKCLTCYEILRFNHDSVNGIGTVEKIKQHIDKTGQEMAFVKIEDETDSLDLVIMSSLYKRIKTNFKKGDIIFFKGKKSNRGSVLVDTLKTVNEVEK